MPSAWQSAEKRRPNESIINLFTSVECFACLSDLRSYVFEAFCPGWVFQGSLVLGDGPDQEHLYVEKSRHRWAPFPKSQACWAPGSQALAHGAWISHMGPPSCGPTTCRRGCRKPVLCVLGGSWNHKLLKGVWIIWTNHNQTKTLNDEHKPHFTVLISTKVGLVNIVYAFIFQIQNICYNQTWYIYIPIFYWF